ncbi:Anti-anti-sigma regulatory factor (antagonist of anti-sigma factor) [Nonomuraea solani]|uniref:Anti-anti-sigma regulatory factor (Antagonist of anti-sigma factor) n=1 Tax=Nonomuraea solani TaxID=1144553 RepID=A0A1H5VV53_9ACTN|nr:STAS domain-containing protein [Nonomuraea solani]SEF91179.1 Anti-anti-sigma regulatory factor (antagonist of anti-sigma factor) [Nonomuraea solani]
MTSGARQDHEAPSSEHLLYVDHMLRVTCTVMPGPSVIRLIGEIDGCNSAEVSRTLSHAWRIDDELIMDLGGLTFADVSGARALLAFTAAGPVQVRDVPHQIRRLMGLMGVPSFGRPAPGSGQGVDPAL